MKLMFLLLVTTILVSCSCNPIKYKSDLGFMNSAQANSLEYFVRVNGSPCKDMDGKMGLCAKRIESNKALNFSMEAREYGYEFSLSCTKAINSDFTISIEKGKPYSFIIVPEKFLDVRSFTCIGEIVPNDRDQQISAKWYVRVVIFDGKYVEREAIYKTTKRKKDWLIFGKHARYVYINGKRFKKRTGIEIKGEGPFFGYSESERMRFNYYGY